MVQVRIYDNRLEVWNPGSLPPELSIEQLYQEHSSHPRNPRLAGVFHRAKLVEKWGTGTTRIINACKTHGLTTPDFVIESGMFIVRFTVNSDIQQQQENKSLNTRQLQALNYIQKNGSITVAIYQREYNVGERQARRDLSILVKSGLIDRVMKGVYISKSMTE
jgi:ATP-dependent DNA helicase RecG